MRTNNDTELRKRDINVLEASNVNENNTIYRVNVPTKLHKNPVVRRVINELVVVHAHDALI